MIFESNTRQIQRLYLYETIDDDIYDFDLNHGNQLPFIIIRLKID